MTLRVLFGIDPALRFEQPVEVLRASSPAEMAALFERADAALRDGYYVAGALFYEPGAVLGIYTEPQRAELKDDRAAFAFSPLRARIKYGEYARTIGQIHAAIRDGEVYQINYTVPFDGRFTGDAEAAYAFLARRSAAAYSAFVEYDGRAIVSLSPELFLRFDGSRIETKPMKGTATLDRRDDLRSAKNRAEHVMIVDLLRNDLHRICEGVAVERLFEEETYPTFVTMTSTIAGTLREGVRLAEIFRSTFPCGSVTGAPKRAAIDHIARFEGSPREAYTGSIGYLTPQRRGWWNVAIRTLQLDTQQGSARFDAGGGIVADSDARSEWNEIAVKSRFLRDAIEPFAFWETFASDGPAGAHFARLAGSARDFDVVFDAERAAGLLAERKSATRRLIKLRLHLDGELEILDEPLHVPEDPVRVCFAPGAVDSTDPMLRYKSSWRPAHERAAAHAARNECFDALLANERGELTEGARTNLFLERDGRLLTPPLACGVLPGILRERLVSEGVAREQILRPADLASADAVYIGNSARGLMRATLAGEDSCLISTR